jgi:hypothetical protein
MDKTMQMNRSNVDNDFVLVDFRVCSCDYGVIYVGVLVVIPMALDLCAMAALGRMAPALEHPFLVQHHFVIFYDVFSTAIHSFCRHLD